MSLSFPLDTDGFLRRACPTCVREFKWLIVEDAPSATPPERFYCPYCGASAAPNEWFNLDQLAYIEAEALDEALRPSLEEVSESLRRLEQSSEGFIKFSTSMEGLERKQAAPVFEPNDMKQVFFTCHPSEPLKIDDAWDDKVHCLHCGRLSDATT